MSESDPHGKHPHSKGAKLDAGKNRLHLIMGGFAHALWEIGRVGTHGADKYTDNGWEAVPDGINRYTDAMHRHILKEVIEGEIDEESQMYHAAQVAWNSLARLELMLREKEKDNAQKQRTR